MGVKWVKPIYVWLLKNAFKEKKIVFDINNKISKTDLVLRSTHEWYSPAIRNYNNDIFINGVDIEPLNPFFEYTCPYICWSGEPLRCQIKNTHLPIIEFNTIKSENQLNMGPYNMSIYKDTIWWDMQRYFFDNIIKTYWIPFLLLQDLDINTTDIRLYEENYPKPYDFVYFGSNCNQNIRETLFQKLKLKELPLNNGTRAYGLCQNTNRIEHDFQDETINGWKDNHKIYKKFKFVFAIENSLNSGYITEKIYIAFQSGSVPIYYGPAEIKDYFNENSFYYLNDKFADPYNPTDNEFDNIVNELKQLTIDENETTGWRKFLKHPVLNTIPEMFKYNINHDDIVKGGEIIKILYDTSINSIMSPEKRLPEIKIEYTDLLRSIYYDYNQESSYKNLFFMTIITNAYMNEMNLDMYMLRNYFDIFKLIGISSDLYDILVYCVQKYIFDNNKLTDLTIQYEQNIRPNPIRNDIGLINYELQKYILQNSIIIKNKKSFQKLFSRFHISRFHVKLSVYDVLSNLIIQNQPNFTLMQDKMQDNYSTLMQDNLQNKYLKYKNKYLEYKKKLES
jgi:hypothetical protein